ncbi:trehalose-phosphatase [Diaphorobacter aerolatus]|uniref:Trehalose 6-phosphate phosphatase n=1 Tax=Diaphorobacter aerolatus TaxID=1288495 RepID=A0A7H0GNZ4_9BURK|nr:trehalose-phosphatase [Diaphorobacter aerolatus]QNP50010.1 trehalose-phosphatase [Diaphorobacter aerolatus]
MHGLPRLTLSHALFLDFDGTLVDIASQPDAVRVQEGTVQALAVLNQSLQGALAIVTGRTLADIDYYLAPLKLTVASEHGAHLRLAGEAASSTPEASVALDAAAQRLAHALLEYPDLLLETKTSGLALHYRNAPLLEPVCSALMSELARELPGMELLRGKCVLELKPAGKDKGRAVLELMRLPTFAGRTPIFVGDDITDEAAFTAVQQSRGIGVKIGAGESHALERCESPAQVCEWLRISSGAITR